MKRKYNSRQAMQSIERLREAIPHVKFTTDIITGFPGESEEDFEASCSFARSAKFLMIHAFPYSSRRGTPAAEMDGQVPEAIRHERVRALSALQRDITATLLSEAIQDSPEVTVLFEDYENGFAFGHTDNFIEVRVPSPVSLHSVTAQVRLCDADQGSVIGELV